MMSVASQVARIQPRIEISDLLGSPQCDELINDSHTFDRSYPDDPDFDRPTPEEEREGHEIMACMTLDHFLPPTTTFAEFLANQARLCNIRDEHPWFVWLGSQIEELARRAEFTRARTPEEYEARVEVMSAQPAARSAVCRLRGYAAALVCRDGETACQILDAVADITPLLRS